MRNKIIWSKKLTQIPIMLLGNCQWLFLVIFQFPLFNIQRKILPKSLFQQGTIYDTKSFIQIPCMFVYKDDFIGGRTNRSHLNGFRSYFEGWAVVISARIRPDTGAVLKPWPMCKVDITHFNMQVLMNAIIYLSSLLVNIYSSFQLWNL